MGRVATKRRRASRRSADSVTMVLTPQLLLRCWLLLLLWKVLNYRIR